MFKILIIISLLLKLVLSDNYTVSDPDKHKVVLTFNNTVSCYKSVLVDEYIDDEVGDHIVLTKCTNQEFADKIKFLENAWKPIIFVDYNVNCSSWVDIVCYTKGYYIKHKNKIVNVKVSGATGQPGLFKMNIMAGLKNIAHEFGHSLGLKHAHAVPGTSSIYDLNKSIYDKIDGKSIDGAKEYSLRAGVSKNYNPISLMHYNLFQIDGCYEQFNINNISYITQSIWNPKRKELVHILPFIGKFITYFDFSKVILDISQFSCVCNQSPSIFSNGNSFLNNVCCAHRYNNEIVPLNVVDLKWRLLKKGTKIALRPIFDIATFDIRISELEGDLWISYASKNFKEVKQLLKLKLRDKCNMNNDYIIKFNKDGVWMSVNSHQRNFEVGVGSLKQIRCSNDDFIEDVILCCDNIWNCGSNSIMINQICIDLS